MRNLRPDELLAVEPGNLPLEVGRHHQFARFNVPHTDGREWYAPEPPLLAHIARLNAIYSKPALPPRRPPRRETRAVTGPLPPLSPEEAHQAFINFANAQGFHALAKIVAGIGPAAYDDLPPRRMRPRPERGTTA